MPTSLPDGPPGRIRNTWRIMSDPRQAYCDFQKRYGDMFTVPAMNGTVVVTCTPAGAKAVFSTRSEDTRPFAVEAMRPLVGKDSVLVLHGQEHFRERRVLMPPFHGPRMKAYGKTIQDIAREQISRWSDGQTIVVQDEMLAITFRVIIHTIFGVSDAARVKAYVAAITHLVDTLKPMFVFFRAAQHWLVPGWTAFKRAVETLDAMLYEDISDARGAEPNESILSLLVASTYEDGTPMPDEAIRDELVTLLFAGHETTAVALAFCVGRLHRHPEAAAWLRAEILATDGTPEHLSTSDALEAFWKETLRLDTIVPDVLRVLERDLDLEGVTVPAGTSVAVAIERVHRNEALYANAEVFRPQRFLERRFSPFEFMPFGGGVRRCVGMALATYELELVLAELAKGPRLEVVSEDRYIRRNLVMGPSEGVRAVVRPPA